eukprot:scaffold27367_cov35-Phaeocystis_antarctica.AAC.1
MHRYRWVVALQRAWARRRPPRRVDRAGWIRLWTAPEGSTAAEWAVLEGEAGCPVSWPLEG